MGQPKGNPKLPMLVRGQDADCNLSPVVEFLANGILKTAVPLLSIFFDMYRSI
jgi:hypothetical protein